jgi:hypothetical protein
VAFALIVAGVITTWIRRLHLRSKQLSGRGG